MILRFWILYAQEASNLVGKVWHTHITAYLDLQDTLQAMWQRKHNGQRTHSSPSEQLPEAVKAISDKESSPTGIFGIHRESKVTFANLTFRYNLLLKMANSENTYTWICFQWDLTNEKEHHPGKFKTRAKRIRMLTVTT